MLGVNPVPRTGSDLVFLVGQLAFQALAEQADGTPESLLFAHRMVAVPQMLMGQLGPARDHHERSLGLLDSPNRGELPAQSVLIPRVLAKRS